jgi:hypothetical protein
MPGNGIIAFSIAATQSGHAIPEMAKVSFSGIFMFRS